MEGKISARSDSRSNYGLRLNTARLVRAFLFRGVILAVAVIVLCRSDCLHDNKEPDTPTQAYRAQCYEPACISQVGKLSVSVKL